jgi:hypothetical protein
VRHVEILAEVPEDVCRLLHIDTTSRAVMIHQEIVSHIFERRSFRDAAMLVGVLAREEFNPLYCGRDFAYPRSFFIMESPFVGARDQMMIILKRVSASASASRHDEIWVVTAVAVGDTTLHRMMRGNRFVIHRTTRDR